jgi:hypothetical protein
MGVETPLPPTMINAAAPDRKPPRRIKAVEIIICRFFMAWVNRIDSCLLLQSINLIVPGRQF